VADRLELLKEAERRGILPPAQAALLAEARSRGLIDAPDEQSNDIVESSFASKARLGSLMGFTPQQTPEQFRGFSKSGIAKALPLVAGGVAGLATGGLGLIPSAIATALGAGAGEAGRRALSDEPLDPKAIALEGGKQGAGALVGGSILKTLGWAARKIFVNPLSAPQEAAAGFARKEGIPFPLSSAQPGKAASVVQQTSRGPILGDIRTHTDATRVAQFLNRNVNGQAGALAPKASPVDEAATKGEQPKRQVFGWQHAEA